MRNEKNNKIVKRTRKRKHQTRVSFSLELFSVAYLLDNRTSSIPDVIVALARYAESPKNTSFDGQFGSVSAKKDASDTVSSGMDKV